jgi:hypothetical protein
MHESIFSYGLSRPYPFRWFTPTVIIGAILATALFSFLNVAATGYELKTVESSNPNATVEAKTFFSKWPAFMTGNNEPTCDTKIMGVGNQYYTTNTAFSYKLEEIYQNASDGVFQYFGDVPYYNNALRDCTIPEVEISFQGLDRSALQIARQQWGAELRAKILCYVDIPEGSRQIGLSTTYDLNSPVNRFPGRNETTKPSLWWGESLLAWYYIKLTSDIYASTQLDSKHGSKYDTYKGYIEYQPPLAPIDHADDYKSPNFFQNQNSTPGCFFVAWSGNGVEDVIQYCEPKNATRPFTLDPLWTTAATITKVFHATILTDLGQRNPNILIDHDLLLYFAKNVTDIAAQQDGGDETWGWGNNIRVVDQKLAPGPYKSENATKWKLASQPSFMSVTYLCQGPKLKSTSSLIFSVLVADLVLLQLLWTVFILIVDFFMNRRYPNMASCQGCMRAQGPPVDGFEMLRTKSVASDSELTSRPVSAYTPLAGS